MGSLLWLGLDPMGVAPQKSRNKYKMAKDDSDSVLSWAFYFFADWNGKWRRCPLWESSVSASEPAPSCMKRLDCISLGNPSAVYSYHWVKYSTLQTPSWEVFNTYISLYYPGGKHVLSGCGNLYYLLSAITASISYVPIFLLQGWCSESLTDTHTGRCSNHRGKGNLRNLGVYMRIAPYTPEGGRETSFP